MLHHGFLIIWKTTMTAFSNREAWLLATVQLLNCLSAWSIEGPPCPKDFCPTTPYKLQKLRLCSAHLQKIPDLWPAAVPSTQNRDGACWPLGGLNFSQEVQLKG